MATPYMTVVVTNETSSRAAWRAAAGLAKAINASTDADPLLAFGPESTAVAAGSNRRIHPRGRPLYVALCAAALSCATACIGLAYFRPVQPPPPNSPSARDDGAVINSRPSGAAVTVDGAFRGTTPIALSLPAGLHTLELRSGRLDRVLPLMIGPGAHESRDIELESSTGISNEHSAGDQSAGAPPDSTSTRSFAPSTGWIAVAAPIELTISERERRIGLSTNGRLLLPAGSHELKLSNDTLEFNASMPVEVLPGQVVTLEVQVPNGLLSINAVPWAEALVDGRLVGVTPITDLSLPIGPHEIVWRHPQLGKRRQSISLGARLPARASIDLRQ